MADEHGHARADADHAHHQAAEVAAVEGLAGEGEIVPLAQMGAVIAHAGEGGRGNGPAVAAAVQRMQHTAGNRATRQAVQRATHTPVQRDLPAVPNYQLTPPTLQMPTAGSRYHLGGDYQLHLDPQIEAQIQLILQQQVAPASVRPALSTLRLGTIPTPGAGSSASATPYGPQPLPAVPVPTTPPAAATPTPAAAGPAPAPGADPAPPHPGSPSDIMDAILAVPAVDTLVTQLQTQALDTVRRDWNRLGTGGRIGVISAGTAIVVPSLVAAMANPQSRTFLLGQLNGRLLPVPGAPWLHAEVNIGEQSLMFGLHLDVATMPGLGPLMQRIGFGPGSPSAIGGPPQPEPFVPGQRMIQRQADGAPVAVQRDGPAPATAPAPAPAAGTPAPATAPPGAIPADLQTFRDHGPYPAAANGQTIVPSTSRGGFNARYDPVSMVMTVTVNVAMTFVDGFTINGSRVTAADSSLNGAATAINRMLTKIPAGRKRDAALDKVRTDWTWSGPGDPRITTWMSGYRSSVQGAWGSAGTGLSFKSSHTGWDAQLANVNVVVNTTNVTAPAGGGAAPAAGPSPTHTTATIFKTADDNSDFGAEVNPGSATSGTDQVLRLGSGQTTARSRLLHQQVQFANNSDTLDTAGKNFLNQYIVTFQAPAGGTGTTLDITGHASTTGDTTPEGQRHNQELSEKRAQAVADYLKTTSVGGQTLRNAATRIKSTVGAGTTGATEEAGWRRVDIDAAGGQEQNIAAHEFGHMLGLADEYAMDPNGLISGTGRAVGAATGHNASAVGQGLPGSVAENNDNIMSLGSTVRPQHYTTFMEALRTVTGSTEWKI